MAATTTTTMIAIAIFIRGIPFGYLGGSTLAGARRQRFFLIVPNFRRALPWPMGDADPRAAAVDLHSGAVDLSCGGGDLGRGAVDPYPHAGDPSFRVDDRRSGAGDLVTRRGDRAR